MYSQPAVCGGGGGGGRLFLPCAHDETMLTRARLGIRKIRGRWHTSTFRLHSILAPFSLFYPLSLFEHCSVKAHHHIAFEAFVATRRFFMLFGSRMFCTSGQQYSRGIFHISGPASSNCLPMAPPLLRVFLHFYNERCSVRCSVRCSGSLRTTNFDIFIVESRSCTIAAATSADNGGKNAKRIPVSSPLKVFFTLQHAQCSMQT